MGEFQDPGLLGRGRGSILPVLLFILAMVWSPVNADLYSVGRSSTSGKRSSTDNLGKTEGCFSKFDV